MTVGSRRYDMQARTRAVEAARARAVQAAYELLLQPDCRELGLDAVARRAGVSRVTLYNQFGSRRLLLLELFQELGRRMGAERIHAAMRLADPLQAMTAVIRESTRGSWREQQAVRKLFAFSVLDGELQSRGRASRARAAPEPPAPRRALERGASARARVARRRGVAGRARPAFTRSKRSRSTPERASSSSGCSAWRALVWAFQQAKGGKSESTGRRRLGRRG